MFGRFPKGVSCFRRGLLGRSEGCWLVPKGFVCLVSLWHSRSFAAARNIATGAFFQKSMRKSVKKCPLALRPLPRPLRTLQGGLAPPSRYPSQILSRFHTGPRRDPAARRGQNRAGGRARSGPPPAHPSGAPSPRTPLAAPYASSGRGQTSQRARSRPKKGCWPLRAGFTALEIGDEEVSKRGAATRTRQARSPRPTRA